MKTQLHWAIHHAGQAIRAFRFRAAWWWLSQRVEFATWRVRLEETVPAAGPATRRMRRPPSFQMF
ncbi:hypothetical protein [Nitrospira moscoviensis]|jgi:hypothetical protein|uniref:Uncharacterized protein n=1 Tax=Nitrospira moscoviensis TaxID=42253 RepID=A0A0K2GHU1_NITMO|nr:hypothetical protein [Nitrospira moscoviensis]ALA60409.1 hypothetical protein NITMOv2_4025 [Nitrospira moscoviensis]